MEFFGLAMFVRAYRNKIEKGWDEKRASTVRREQEFYAKNPATLDFKRTYRLSDWRTSSDQQNLKNGLYLHLKALSFQTFSLWHAQDRTLVSSSRWVRDQELWTDGVVSISRRSIQATPSEVAELNQKQLLSRPYENYEWREAVSVVDCLSNHVVFSGGELRGSDHPVTGGVRYINPESANRIAVFRPGPWIDHVLNEVPAECERLLALDAELRFDESHKK